MKQVGGKNMMTGKYQFLSGGGEMGNLMRSKDWSVSLVGTPDTWPQSLRTTLSIILNSKFPMFLFWGPDLICFYNDAYRPSLGNDGKHPKILGSRGEDYWQEIWPVIKPLIDQVLAGGEATWSEDQLIPIYRNGKMEDVYWTFSYSPVNDESGKPAGVFVTCNETTDKVNTRNKLEESKNQLEFAIEAAELATWDFNPFTYTFTGNSRLKEWFGLPDEYEMELYHVTDSIAEKDRQRILDRIPQSLDYDSGGNYIDEFTIIHPITKSERIVQVRGKASFNEDKIAYRLNGTLEDVTNEVIAQRKLEESERSLRLMIEQAPVAMCVFKGENHVVEIANEKMLDLWGRPATDVINKPIFEGLPEAKGQGLETIVDNVYKKGERFQANERPVNLPRNDKIETTYINFVYEPLKNADGRISGILAIANDVTFQVIARKKIEESEEQIRIALEGGELGTFDYYPETNTLHWSEKTKELFGLSPDAVVNYNVYLNAIHPDDRNASKSIAEQQAKLMEGGFYEMEYRTIGVNDGRIRWIRSKGKVNYNAAGTPVRYSGVTQDITQLKLAEEKLREFKFMADNASDPFIVTREDGTFAYLNKKALEKWGYTEEEAKHINGLDVDTVYDPEAFKNIFEKALQENLPPFETIHRHKSGATYPVEINMTTIMLGSKPHLFAVARDITERKKAEQSLKESEEKFRTMAESSDILIGVNDETVNAVYFNKVWEKLTGRSVEDLMNLGWADLLHPDDRQPFLDKFFRAFEKKESYSGEFRILNKDGNYSWLYAQVQVRLHADGSYAGHISSCIDITERKQSEEEIKRSEEALKQSEQRLRSLVESASFPIGVYIGREMRIELVNDSILKAWGRNHDVVGKLYADVLTELRGQGIYEQLDAVFTTGIPFHANNQRIDLVVDGKLQPYYYNYSFTPLYNEMGEIYGILNTAANVTELNIANKKAEASEKEFRQLADSLPELVWTTDNKGEQSFASKRWKEFTGLDPYDASTFEKMVHPDDLENIIKVWTGCLASGNIYKTQVRLKSKIGDYQWFYVHGEPLKDEQGQVEKWVGSFTNFNVQKRAEEELIKALIQIEESESRFRDVANTVPVLIWMAGPDKLRNFFNAAWLNFTGRTVEQEFGTGWVVSIHPDDLEKCMSIYNEAFDHRKDYNIEYRLRRHDGVYRWISARGVPRFTANGSFEGFIGACMDIHEQVIYQQKLKEDEEKLNIIIEASELGNWELDLVTRQVSYSERYLEILGHKKGEILNHQEIIKHLHPDDLQIREAAFKTAFDTGQLHYETRIIWNDESLHWIEGKGKVFYDEAGKPLKMLGTVRDITEEKNYQQQLKEREEKFRLLADSMPQHIWTADTAGNLNYFNQSVYDYSGLTPEQINTDGWIQIVHPEDREKNITEWLNSVSTGKDFLFEHRFRRYDGEYRWQLSRAIPQRDAAGNIQMWVGTSTDIQEIKEQDQQKDFFISMASHELKTPITSIKGYVQLLQSSYAKSDDGFLKKSLAVIDKQVLTLTTLISDLLDVSKIKSGSLVLNKQEFEISIMMQEVVAHIQHINPDYSIHISDTGALVYADRERIGQVLINFLTNAVKYSPNSKEIIVKNFIEDDHVVVSVHDSGIGINKANQEKIFERFYRVEGKDEKTYPGFGIGLFICAQIIERHQGKIGVTSEPGKGSVFYFSIPLSK